MKEKDIEEKVIEIINNGLKDVKRKLKVNNDGKWKGLEFNADLGFDSLKTVEAFMECENIFGISFSDNEIVKTKTIGELINKIIEKIKYIDYAEES